MKFVKRILLRFAYRTLLVFWFVFRPTDGGAYVAVWCRGRLLILRNSYRSYWTFPAGGQKCGESMAETGARELMEEVGISVPPQRLKLFDYFISKREFKTDRSTVFEIEFDDLPELCVDNVEVVEAKFVNISDLRDQQYELTCIASQYLDRKLAEQVPGNANATSS